MFSRIFRLHFFKKAKASLQIPFIFSITKLSCYENKKNTCLSMQSTNIFLFPLFLMKLDQLGNFSLFFSMSWLTLHVNELSIFNFIFTNGIFHQLIYVFFLNASLRHGKHMYDVYFFFFFKIFSIFLSKEMQRAIWKFFLPAFSLTFVELNACKLISFVVAS